MTEVALPAILMLVLFALNVPVAFAIAISALSFFFLTEGVPVQIFFQKMLSASESYPLLAVPFFVLAGSLMNAAGITRRLLVLADALVGHLTGALAQACTVLATLLGGLTASSSADAAMLAKLFGPEMVKRGYSAAFAAAITSSAATITAMIPPGIGLIIYGYLADVSVGRLFLAGVVPGLLIMAALLVTTWVIAKRRGYAPVRERFVGFAEVGRAARDALPALLIPIFIIIGLRYGIFTTTEAGAIVVLVTVAIGGLAYRELTWAKLPMVLRESVLDTASVMLLICAASAFGFYMAWERLPPQMAAWIAGLTRDPTTLLLLTNLLLLVLGTALEGTAALIILTPIFVPVILAFGVDPVQFGIVLVMNLTIAGITPPVGQMMFISCAVLKVPMETYTVEILPFLGAMTVVLLLVTLVPEVSLWLPDLVMGR
jgi:tripartite ATP-independent transporter DctM subunit